MSPSTIPQGSDHRRNVSKGRIVTIQDRTLSHHSAPLCWMPQSASRHSGAAGESGESAVIVGSMKDLYFVLNPMLGLIKIGISDNVDRRVCGLESGCGVPLILLRIMRNGSLHETNLHFAFAASRLYGEWFAPTDDLLGLAYGDEGIPEFLERKIESVLDGFDIPRNKDRPQLRIANRMAAERRRVITRYRATHRRSEGKA
jgi:hypothetical protein